MSHFTVAVFHHPNQNIDSLLAPYDENLEVEYDEDGYSYNPDAKWDWYDIGGRWPGLLRTKDGNKVDQASVKDIDLSPDQKAIEAAKRWWAVCIDKELPKTNEETCYSAYRNEKYYRDRFGDINEFARESSLLTTHAVITPDGEWHEVGTMGWFGFSSQTIDDEKRWSAEYHKFFENAEPDDIVTIVDCHI